MAQYFLKNMPLSFKKFGKLLEEIVKNLTAIAQCATAQSARLECKWYLFYELFYI